MWSDLLVAIAELIGITAGAGDDRPAGPPIDVGTALLLLGLACVVGGLVTRMISHLPHALSYAVIGLGIGLAVFGLRRAGR